jgi:hypothetical protein
MQDSAGAQFHDHEYIQCAKRGSDRDEKVISQHYLDMVAD